VTNVRPLPVYADLFPAGPDLAKIAYHFLGDYTCDSHQHIDVVRELNARVTAWWVRAWAHGPGWRPVLKLCVHGGRYMLVDTRGLVGTTQLCDVDRAESAELLTDRTVAARARRTRSPANSPSSWTTGSCS
jgi:hypothetical protein